LLKTTVVLHFILSSASPALPTEIFGFHFFPAGEMKTSSLQSRSLFSSILFWQLTKEETRDIAAPQVVN